MNRRSYTILLQAPRTRVARPLWLLLTLLLGSAAAEPCPPSLTMLLSDGTGEFSGHLQYHRRELRQRDDLVLDIMRNLSSGVEDRSIPASQLTAAFPDGTVCTLAIETSSPDAVLYRLELQQHRHTFRALRGYCRNARMPALHDGEFTVNLTDDPHGRFSAPTIVLSQSLK